jgi:hypothetical protein
MKKIILGIIIAVFVLTVGSVNAQVSGSGSATPTSGSGVPPQSQSNQPLPKLGNPLKVNSVQDVIFLAVDIAIYVGTAIAILSIIFVGFKFVEARGNEKKIIDAKQWFLYVIIGFAILISSKVIVEIVKNTLIKSGVVNQSVWTPPN